jgi:putative FmdB family regulatory protein
MPIYEFRCRTCRKKTTALVMVRERIGEVRCSSCGSADLERLWSRFATVKSEDARLDSLAESAEMGGFDENDPRSVATWMKKMGEAMGEDVGDEIDAAMDEEFSGKPGGTEPGDGEAGGTGDTGAGSDGGGPGADF